jgi:hypothetical protein
MQAILHAFASDLDYVGLGVEMPGCRKIFKTVNPI